jgi:hypothetical protein
VRYYVPRSLLALRCEAQAGPVDKFGGQPWGFPSEQWPMCRQCGRPQSHVAQLHHDGARLDLGGKGRVLVLFQCEWGPDPCETFRPEYGANAAMIIDAGGGGLTSPPDPFPPEVPELRVVEWTAQDDGIAPDRYRDFFDDSRFSALYQEGLLERIPLDTKIGGPPRWLQSFQDGPPPPWRFVLQLPEGQVGDGPEPTPEETGWGVQRRGPQGVEFEYPPGTGRGEGVRVRVAVSAGAWWVLGPNFGMGMAYVFVDTEADPPAAVMFWQR